LSAAASIYPTIEFADVPLVPDAPILDFPESFQFLFQPARYKVSYGGRGSGKSWAFARALVILATQRPLRILCVREFQNSIAESVHRLLSDQIENLGLSAYYEVQQAAILGRAGTSAGGSEFFFYGIRNNPTKVKSAEGIDICWVEEAEKVSERSWEILIPTIRSNEARTLISGLTPEIWITFNPDEENDPTYQRFVAHPPPGVKPVQVNWTENPWFPEELKLEKDYLASVDPEAYEHVWNGQCRRNASSQIFRGKYVIESFDVPNPVECARGEMWDGPYFGADWGFANDPTCLTKSWIDMKTQRLLIEDERFGYGTELDDIGPMFRQVPGVERCLVLADCARPETISHVRNKAGLRIEAAEKWKGSVEDGIAFLKSFKQIVIHTRCRHMAQEARLYSYKVDRLTQSVLAEVKDGNDHGWDSVRYALQPLIMAGTSLGVWARL